MNTQICEHRVSQYHGAVVTCWVTHHRGLSCCILLTERFECVVGQVDDSSHRIEFDLINWHILKMSDTMHHTFITHGWYNHKSKWREINDLCYADFHMN